VGAPGDRFGVIVHDHDRVVGRNAVVVDHVAGEGPPDHGVGLGGVAAHTEAMVADGQRADGLPGEGVEAGPARTRWQHEVAMAVDLDQVATDAGGGGRPGVGGLGGAGARSGRSGRDQLDETEVAVVLHDGDDVGRDHRSVDGVAIGQFVDDVVEQGDAVEALPDGEGTGVHDVGLTWGHVDDHALVDERQGANLGAGPHA
jgi:hypothetical protein